MKVEKAKNHKSGTISLSHPILGSTSLFIRLDHSLFGLVNLKVEVHGVSTANKIEVIGLMSVAVTV